MFGTAAHRKHTHTYAHVKVESSSRVSRLGSKGAQVESRGMKRWRGVEAEECRWLLGGKTVEAVSKGRE